MRFAVLVSGSGTNLQALLDAEARGELAPGEIAVVVSNRPNAFAIERARAAEKTAVVIDHEQFADRQSFEHGLLAELERHTVDAVVLAGFMRVLSPHFLSRFEDRVINVHPALLPAFPGMNAQDQALAYGVKIAGCTVHFVDESVDGGAIILQSTVPILDGDTVDDLRDRILTQEHALLPRAAQLLAAGKLSRAGRHVRVLP